MRGKAAVHQFVSSIHGITPAYAGKSFENMFGENDTEDHPRVCGEKWYGRIKDAEDEGSPPRMRGKGLSPQARFSLPRITPAYAGKSHCQTDDIPVLRDHPRVCGEKKLFVHLYVEKLGSPPRMRGKDVVACICAELERITPAYAGKRAGPMALSTTNGDHPRICGEKPHYLPSCPNSLGSPPHMRGKD